ncbi:mannitol dehydrogenase [Ligilactobacillus salivarius]|uniref:mannitol dehydrogenase family protein n=1 Tax=Ligilactobacillus salivarius TaxID=1624 RepID=UPI000C14D786|nr:mannitol dehydrogenase family protein [Ligilactobacillus salivarius]PHY96251.1 mannitol dehydrogenase [Ligilactobacillus salivarius]
MVKLTDDYVSQEPRFTSAKITVPKYNQQEITDSANENPVWVHFGGGNLFRCFHAKIAQDLLNIGELKGGIIVAETYDEEVVDRIYKEYNNRILSVTMLEDGTLKKELLASVADAIYANQDRVDDWKKLVKIFENPSLQFVTLSITEKGYTVKDVNGELTSFVQNDIKAGPLAEKLQANMSLIAALLYKRFKAGSYPIAMVSTDNFSENGKRFQENVMEVVNGWYKNSLVEKDFIEYLEDTTKVTFPWSMIDRITPNPAKSVADELKEEGFEDTQIVHTNKHTNIAPFGNTEETHYLVIEDAFPNGRPDLGKVGVILTDRETVNDADQMKVTACLNPLHTALAIFGNLLGYKSISAEMEDNDLKKLVENLGYGEDLPVVKDPKIINPKTFINELLTKRLPNKNIPDTPQRIASDTSQKIPIRYGVTINHYVESDDLKATDLECIPLIIAGWCRYLMAVDDEGNEFTPSPDPLLNEMQGYVADIKLGDKVDSHDRLKEILSNESIFGNDLYSIGLGSKVEEYFTKLISAEGAVRKTIKEVNEKVNYKF